MSNFWNGMLLGLVVGMVVVSFSEDAQGLVEQGKKAVAKEIKKLKKQPMKLDID